MSGLTEEKALAMLKQIDSDSLIRIPRIVSVGVASSSKVVITYLDTIDDLKKDLQSKAGDMEIEYRFSQSPAFELTRATFRTLKVDQLYATVGALCQWEDPREDGKNSGIRCLTSLHGWGRLYESIEVKINESLPSFPVDAHNEMKTEFGDAITIRFDDWLNSGSQKCQDIDTKGESKSKSSCMCRVHRLRMLKAVIPAPLGFLCKPLQEVKEEQTVFIYGPSASFPATVLALFVSGRVSRYVHNGIISLQVDDEFKGHLVEGLSGAMVTTQNLQCFGIVIGATQSSTVYVTPIYRIQDYLKCSIKPLPA